MGMAASSLDLGNRMRNPNQAVIITKGRPLPLQYRDIKLKAFKLSAKGNSKT